jgi:hypothetical protein
MVPFEGESIATIESMIKIPAISDSQVENLVIVLIKEKSVDYKYDYKHNI